jgi:hypothetical protein
MNDAFIALIGALLYGSGLLFWPVCAFLWHRKRRTRALRLVFFCEFTCLLVLAGFAAFSHGILAHGYSWLMLMILANIIFTLLAIGAAIFDYASDAHSA